MGFYISIIDYEMGNLKSVYKLLKHLDIDVVITDKPNEIVEADGVILPGVGAFGDAMEQLEKKKMIPIIHQVVSEKTPLLGICLGMQLIFSRSIELGEFKGLGLIKGDVASFDKTEVEKIPHIGWNNVNFQTDDHYLIQNIPNNSYFYFVHGFYGIPVTRNDILGTTQYGKIEFCSMISHQNLVATQFHPEKSGKNGLTMMKNFVEHCKK